MDADLDLTPFGFTPTESSVYRALLDLGPSSGYAVSRALSIARANGYQALDGLVAKGVAVRAQGEPKIYRAVSPDALVATVTARETERLERLELSVAGLARAGAPHTVAFDGARRLEELALRTAARTSDSVSCLAPGAVLARLLPLWRKRAADGSETILWSVGELPSAFPVPVAGSVPPERAARFFPGGIVLLVTPDSAVCAAGERLTGWWTSQSLEVGLAGAALEALTSPP